MAAPGITDFSKIQKITLERLEYLIRAFHTDLDPLQFPPDHIFIRQDRNMPWILERHLFVTTATLKYGHTHEAIAGFIDRFPCNVVHSKKQVRNQFVSSDKFRIRCYKLETYLNRFDQGYKNIFLPYDDGTVGGENFESVAVAI
jgi:hypothetical protein